MIFININTNDYPEFVQDKMKESANPEQKELLEAWNSLAKNLEFSQEGKYSSTLTINLKEDDKNSLEHVITTIDDNYEVISKF